MIERKMIEAQANYFDYDSLSGEVDKVINVLNGLKETYGNEVRLEFDIDYGYYPGDSTDVRCNVFYKRLETEVEATKRNALEAKRKIAAEKRKATLAKKKAKKLETAESTERKEYMRLQKKYGEGS